MARILFLSAIAIIVLVSPGALLAGTVYTYTGNAYDSCSGTYNTGTGCGPYALSVTFDVMTGTPLNNLTLFGVGSDITASVASFSFTDGSGLDLNQGNAGFYAFNIGTDGSGNITSWAIYACVTNTQCNPGISEQTFNNVNAMEDASVNLGGIAFRYNDPGTWVTSTPEPSSFLLLGTGLPGLVGVLRRKLRG